MLLKNVALKPDNILLKKEQKAIKGGANNDVVIEDVELM